MANFVTLTCPTCGGKLQITNDIERFACIHCGNEHLVRREGGVVSLTPVIEGLTKIQTGVDKTASELAIRRIEEEIRVLILKRDSLISEANILDQKSASARTTRAVAWAMLGFSVIIGLGGFGLLALGISEPVFGIIPGIGTLILAGLFIVVGIINIQKTNTSKTADAKSIVGNEITAMNQDIFQKQHELERHHSIIGD